MSSLHEEEELRQSKGGEDRQGREVEALKAELRQTPEGADTGLNPVGERQSAKEDGRRKTSEDGVVQGTGRGGLGKAKEAVCAVLRPAINRQGRGVFQ